LTVYDDTEFHYKQYGSDGSKIDEVTVISAVKLKHKILLWIVYGAITTFLIGFVVLLYNFEAFFPDRNKTPLHNESSEISDEGLSVIHEEHEIEMVEIPGHMQNKR
jgi:hypothetical protein